MDNPFLEEEADGCIYGGIIVGEVDLEIPEAPAYNLDIFDGHDLHVDELVTAQPMSDAGAEQIEIDVQDSQITITMEYAVVDVEIEVDLSPSTPDQGKAEGAGQSVRGRAADGLDLVYLTHSHGIVPARAHTLRTVVTDVVVVAPTSKNLLAIPYRVRL